MLDRLTNPQLFKETPGESLYYAGEESWLLVVFSQLPPLYHAFQPMSQPPAHTESGTHFFQVRSDEVLDLVQAFHIASLAGMHMGDMSMPYSPTALPGGFFYPDLDDERLCCGFL